MAVSLQAFDQRCVNNLSLRPCALAQYACRRGYYTFYQRVPRMGEELRNRHGKATFGKWLIQPAKTEVLVLDDWRMAGIDAQSRADLMEIIDDLSASKVTIFTR